VPLPMLELRQSFLQRTPWPRLSPARQHPPGKLPRKANPKRPEPRLQHQPSRSDQPGSTKSRTSAISHRYRQSQLHRQPDREGGGANAPPHQSQRRRSTRPARSRRSSREKEKPRRPRPKKKSTSSSRKWRMRLMRSPQVRSRSRIHGLESLPISGSESPMKNSH